MRLENGLVLDQVVVAHRRLERLDRSVRRLERQQLVMDAQDPFVARLDPLLLRWSSAPLLRSTTGSSYTASVCLPSNTPSNRHPFSVRL